MAKETGSTRKCRERFQKCSSVHPRGGQREPSVKAAEPPLRLCVTWRMDAFPTAEKIRSLTPGVPHISTTMALLTSLIIDKRF